MARAGFGESEPQEEIPPDELYDKLKPFEQRVAEDIRDKRATDGRERREDDGRRERAEEDVRREE